MDKGRNRCVDTKYKISIVVAVIGIFGGGGAFLVIDQSTNINTTIGDTIINEFMSNDELRNIGTDIAINLICERAPDDPICS